MRRLKDFFSTPMILALLLPAVFAVGLFVCPVFAAGAESKERDAAERQAFVENNVVFTFYHELGHALIDLLKVPVLGREEDAVDALAVLLSSYSHAPEVADAMIASAAESFAISDEWAAADGEDFVFWDEHSLDPQRFYSIICLYYGGEPDALEEMADEIELPEERRELCVDDRAQAEQAWGAVLARIDREKETQFKKGLSLRKVSPSSEENRAAADLLATSNALEQSISNFNQAFATPDTITVELSNCEDPNAYYDSETRSITLCYELVGEFTDQIDWALENAD